MPKFVRRETLKITTSKMSLENRRQLATKLSIFRVSLAQLHCMLNVCYLNIDDGAQEHML